jgi:hypothetical protein
MPEAMLHRRVLQRPAVHGRQRGLEERGVLAAALEFNGGHAFSPVFRAAASALIQAL